MRVIAMLYGGIPQAMECVSRTNSLCYLVRSSSHRAVEDDGKSGVGFPPAYVFEYAADRLGQLKEAWESGDRAALDACWHKQVPAFQ
jgi:hypothetical protein